MNDKQNNNRIPQNNIKLFLIKLVLASIVFVIVVNLLFNLMFAERLEKVDKILMLNKSKYRNEMKEKIRNELTDGLKKEQMIAEEDKILMYKIYLKIKKEFENLDKSKI